MARPKLMASTHVHLASTHVHQFEVILKEVSTRGVCMLDDDSKLPQHSYDFASIADVPSHPVGTNFHALGVVVNAGDVEHELTKSGTQGSQRTLTIADESLRSIPLRITSQRVEHIGGSVGSIVAVKGLTGAYFGTPKLSAFVDNVDIDPDITEAQKLRERWQHVRMEQVHALLPAFDFTPIASLATEADAKSAVDLLAIVVSAEPPIGIVSHAGKAQRCVNMVVCDASGVALPFTCWCPAEGTLPVLAPGMLLAICGATVKVYHGERQASASLERCTLEPHVRTMPEAAALRAWWATRDHVPSVPLPSLVAIDAVPSLAKGTLVRVVAIVTGMGDVESKWNEAKAAEILRRTLTIADESHRSIVLTVFDWDEQIVASLGGIISVKARKDDFLGVPQLKASSKDVDFAASTPEAHALHAHWSRELPEVTPLRRSATVQPIASIASAATGDKVDLLAVVASAQPPEPYEVKQGKNMGKKGRRINMVVCDESKASVLVKCFCPEEGELPMFEPGTLLAISEARVEWFNGSVSCSCGMAQCELEPQVLAATPLRAWWQTRASLFHSCPPPMVSSVSSCIPLAALPDAWTRGEQFVDVLGVVTGSIDVTTLASHTTMLMRRPVLPLAAS